MSNSTQLVTTEAEIMPELESLLMSIAELEQALLQQDPMMPQYLRKIHLATLKQPELVHILKDEQRAVIIDALMQQTGVLLTAVEEKSAKTTRTKQLAKMSEDDI